MDKRFKGTEEEYIEFRRKKNLINKKYYSKPEVKAKRKIYKKKHDLENKDKISEYSKKHNAIPEVKERIKQWREDNREHLREYCRKPERRVKKRQQDKDYRKRRTNKEGKFWMNKKTREKNKKWYENNREHLRNLRRAYYLSEQGQLSIQNCNHRKLALKKDRPTDLTRKKIREIFDRDKVCVYCGSNIKLTLDHIIALAKGGSCLFNNFVVACKKCNCSKSGRDVFYWYNLQGIEVPKIVLTLLEEQRH